MPDLASQALTRLIDRMTPYGSLHPLMLLTASFVALSGSLDAGTILAVDFDTNSGNYQYGYTFAGYGDPTAGNLDATSGTSQVTQIAVGAGSGGTNALRTTMDATIAGAQLPPDRTYDYLGFATAVNTSFAEPLSSGQLADYTFNLSARAEGFLGGVTSDSGELYIQIFAPDGILGDADGNIDKLIALKFSTGVALAEGFQTSIVNFGDATVAEGSVENFTNFFAFAQQLTFSIAPNEVNMRFGYDAGNVLVVDDVLVDVVPEPVSTLSLALGACVLIGFRRR